MIFFGCNPNMQNKGYLLIMTTTAQIQVPDEHPSLITDIQFLLRNNTQIIFTACQQEIRVFVLQGDQCIRQLVHPTPNYHVTSFVSPNVDTIVAGLSNGQFLGWDLASD